MEVNQFLASELKLRNGGTDSATYSGGRIKRQKNHPDSSDSAVNVTHAGGSVHHQVLSSGRSHAEILLMDDTKNSRHQSGEEK